MWFVLTLSTALLSCIAAERMAWEVLWSRKKRCNKVKKWEQVLQRNKRNIGAILIFIRNENRLCEMSFFKKKNKGKKQKQKQILCKRLLEPNVSFHYTLLFTTRGKLLLVTVRIDQQYSHLCVAVYFPFCLSWFAPATAALFKWGKNETCKPESWAARLLSFAILLNKIQSQSVCSRISPHQIIIYSKALARDSIQWHTGWYVFTS